MTDEPQILDQAVVAELRESVGGDSAFVVELVDAYLAEGPAQLQQMATAATAGDADAIIRPAHTLKSNSATLGATRLAQICRDIEHAGREGRIDGMVERVEQAHRAWEQTVVEMRAAGMAK